MDRNFGCYVKGTWQNGEPFSLYNFSVCICPLASDISPCTCGLSSTTTTSLNCANLNLNDSSIATVVKNTPSWSPVDTVILKGNQLSRVPAQLSKYTKLVNLVNPNLSSNSITSIHATDSLSLLSTPVRLIDLSANSITQITQDALPSNFASDARILLSANPMGALSQTTYQPIINLLRTNGYNPSSAYIDLKLRTGHWTRQITHMTAVESIS